MAYADLSGLTSRVGEAMLIDLSDRDTPATGAVVTSVIDAALADTDALIDGYLFRYALPMASVPALIITLAETITIYKLHSHIVAEKIENDYRDAIKTLEKISKGDVRIPVAGVEPVSSGASGVKTCDRKPEMTRDNMRGLI